MNAPLPPTRAVRQKLAAANASVLQQVHQAIEAVSTVAKRGRRLDA